MKTSMKTLILASSSLALLFAGCDWFRSKPPKPGQPGALTPDFPEKGFFMPTLGGGNTRVGAIYCLQNGTRFAMGTLPDIDNLSRSDPAVFPALQGTTKRKAGLKGALGLAVAGLDIEVGAESNAMATFSMSVDGAMHDTLDILQAGGALKEVASTLLDSSVCSGDVYILAETVRVSSVDISFETSTQINANAKAKLSQGADVNASLSVGSDNAGRYTLKRTFNKPLALFAKPLLIGKQAGIAGGGAWFIEPTGLPTDKLTEIGQASEQQ